MAFVDAVRNYLVAHLPRTPLGTRLITLCVQGGYKGLRVYWFLFRPAVIGVQCIITRGHEVLLIRNTYGRRLWTVPGGGVKPGEKSTVAVRREVYEEVGVTLDSLCSLGVFHGREDYRYDTVHVFWGQAVGYECKIDPGEIDEARWFAIHALPSLAPYAQQAFRLWQAHERHR